MAENKETAQTLAAKYAASYEGAIGPDSTAHLIAMKENLDKGNYAGAALENAKGAYEGAKHELMHPGNAITQMKEMVIDEVKALSIAAKNPASSGKIR